MTTGSPRYHLLFAPTLLLALGCGGDGSVAIGTDAAVADTRGFTFSDGSADSGVARDTGVAELDVGVTDAARGNDSDVPRPDTASALDTQLSSQSCTGPDGRTIAHGDNYTYYDAPRADNCAATAQQRTCDNGQLGGSYGEPACTDYRYEFTAWQSQNACAITTLTEHLYRQCLRDDGAVAHCDKCGGECQTTRPCTSCVGSRGVNLAAGDLSACATNLDKLKANCVSLGCHWDGDQSCILGGSPSCASCFGAQGSCVP